VIIPVFDEADMINAAIRSLKEIKYDDAVEMIVVDGDSSGSTVNCITEPGALRLTSEKGRAIQMNLGAAHASGDMLLFLHADTILPEKGFEKIKEVMANGKYVAGAFNYAIESRHRFLRHIYYTSYLRSRITRIAYGDQAIFIRKDYFDKIGGYPEIPVMEDVELMKKIKKNKDEICILKEGVKTSIRRYEEEGVIYGWLRNHKMRFLYFLGVSPERLAKFYPDVRKRGKR
jgi:rSAM/selenodomain-associated transferase 2